MRVSVRKGRVMGQFDFARVARFVAAGAVGVLLSACSMGNMFAPGKPSETAQLQNTSATPAQTSAQSTNALPAIATERRNCVACKGLITATWAVVGRGWLGPAGNQQNFDLRLRFAGERDDVAVFSERYEISVTITPPGQSAEFVKVIESVGIPYL